MSTCQHDTRDQTPSSIGVRCVIEEQRYEGAVEPLIDTLDQRRGALFTSSFEYPGRYTRWDTGFKDPPIVVTARQREIAVEALNERGRILLPAFHDALARLEAVLEIETEGDCMAARIAEPEPGFAEERRSRQPSVFSALRALNALFAAPGDGHLGFYGAFGYDLAFQFEPVELKRPRDGDQPDLVLYLPDEILVIDHRRQSATLRRYEFTAEGRTTRGLSRDTAPAPFRPASGGERGCDHAPGEYAEVVRLARQAFRRGDLFEVVPGQMFSEPAAAPPSVIFRRLRQRNPAPYGALINLGDEHLVAASPEMFVRVQGRRVETCPISGTVARGKTAIEDAEQIRCLLNSEKDLAELTMCTDVDRNDKSRVCEPHSIEVIGRRQIEMYSRLIHTVDHVEGRLRPGYDALDAFLAHTWAVTVTGAPKPAAMQFIEDHERSPRRWYGGAIGSFGVDGGMTTGLTLRTVRLKDGIAEVRAGATLLYDSDPLAEDRECLLKASALLDAIRRPDRPLVTSPRPRPGAGRRVLMVDHQDSFVHTLGGYFRAGGADVVTLRSGFTAERLREIAPDLVVLSPGPGRPADFAITATIEMALAEALPIFGVCLGLQGIGEYFGARLGLLPEPVHGKPSSVRLLGGRLFAGLPRHFTAGRYHSLHVLRDGLPPDLVVTAETPAGIVMALEHRSLPVAGVQFHPESIMSLESDLGRRLIDDVVENLRPAAAVDAVA